MCHACMHACMCAVRVRAWPGYVRAVLGARARHPCPRVRACPACVRACARRTCARCARVACVRGVLAPTCVRGVRGVRERAHPCLRSALRGASGARVKNGGRPGRTPESASFACQPQDNALTETAIVDRYSWSHLTLTTAPQDQLHVNKLAPSVGRRRELAPDSR